MSTLNLNTNGLETYEIGAIILALLADPTHHDDARTLEVRSILCGRALWFEHKERRHSASSPPVSSASRRRVLPPSFFLPLPLL